MKLPTEKMTVLSTKYISEDDAKKLTEYGEAPKTPEGLPRMETHQYGWLVFVTPEKDVFERFDKALREHGFSTEFGYVYYKAHEQGISVINFDPAGEDGVDLKEFEW